MLYILNNTTHKASYDYDVASYPILPAEQLEFADSEQCAGCYNKTIWDMIEDHMTSHDIILQKISFLLSAKTHF